MGDGAVQSPAVKTRLQASSYLCQRVGVCGWVCRRVGVVEV